MIKKVLYSVFWNKCPNCHQGSVFKHKNPFDFKKFDVMNETCSHCGHKYEKEPGFFYGAMYVSYALMVGWFLVTWAINTFIVKADSISFLIFLILSIVILMTYTFRIARLFWINFFTRYNEHEPIKNNENE